MATVVPYLHFDGTTRGAMEFYKEVLGGELEMSTVGETPWANESEMPGATKDKIMHARLKSGRLDVMAADMMDPTTFKVGDNVSLCIVCDGKAEIEAIYAKLSAGGDVFMALNQAPFGWYAQVTDKFGIDWMLQSEAN
jgi:PhnB protein